MCRVQRAQQPARQQRRRRNSSASASASASARRQHTHAHTHTHDSLAALARPVGRPALRSSEPTQLVAPTSHRLQQAHCSPPPAAAPPRKPVRPARARHATAPPPAAAAPPTQSGAGAGAWRPAPSLARPPLRAGWLPVRACLRKAGRPFHRRATSWPNVSRRNSRSARPVWEAKASGAHTRSHLFWARLGRPGEPILLSWLSRLSWLSATQHRRPCSTQSAPHQPRRPARSQRQLSTSAGQPLSGPPSSKCSLAPAGARPSQPAPPHVIAGLPPPPPLALD